MGRRLFFKSNETRIQAQRSASGMRRMPLEGGRQFGDAVLIGILGIAGTLLLLMWPWRGAPDLLPTSAS